MVVTTMTTKLGEARTRAESSHVSIHDVIKSRVCSRVLTCRLGSALTRGATEQCGQQDVIPVQARLHVGDGETETSPTTDHQSLMHPIDSLMGPITQLAI